MNHYTFPLLWWSCKFILNSLCFKAELWILDQHFHSWRHQTSIILNLMLPKNITSTLIPVFEKIKINILNKLWSWQLHFMKNSKLKNTSYSHHCEAAQKILVIKFSLIICSTFINNSFFFVVLRWKCKHKVMTIMSHLKKLESWKKTW